MAGRTARKIIKAFAVIAVAAVFLLAIAITFTVGWRPFIGANARALTTRKFEATPARLTRGKYLVEAVNGCFDCHSPKDWKSVGAPAVADKVGSGRQWTAEDLPWLVAPNITPDPETGGGNWTDDMFARAIREGIGHDGRALFPIMPYPKYRAMSDEDLASVVVYIRSIPAVKNVLPATQISFPLNRLILAAPSPITSPITGPDMSNPQKRGEYLATIAGCAECHTAQNRGNPIKGMEFAGGLELRGLDVKAISANITPDPSGISYYDEDLFVNTLRTGRVKTRELSPAMPWIIFKNMTDDDLKAIYAFIRTVKPIHHYVDNRESPTQCKLCGLRHGLGDKNGS